MLEIYLIYEVKMEIIKIIGIALVGLIIIVILKQYKPEFTIYVSILVGTIIIFMVLDKLTRYSYTNKIHCN